MDATVIRLGGEVRERLHIVMGLMELIAEEPLSHKQSDYLSRCQASMDVLLSVSNDLLELAEADAPISIEEFELESALTQTAVLMRVVAESRGLEFGWTIEQNLPARILGDKRLVQDMLRRLIRCSLDMPEGGASHLSVTAQPAGTLTFEIQSQAKAGSIADPAAERQESIESALGMRVIRSRLPGLGGSLTANVRNGVVMRRLTLPITVTETAARPAPEPSAVPWQANAPLNLLVAEDSDDSFLLLQAYLADQGHRLTRATNGARAVEIVRTGNFDLVIMDVKMPTMDGYTASRLIREWETREQRPRLPILLLSADEASRQMKIGGSVGCSGYLTKPASKDQVLAALRFYSRPDAMGSLPANLT